MKAAVRISRVILTAGVLAAGVVLAIEAPAVLKLALGILWGGVVFVAALVLLAAALAIVAPGALGVARAENESATAYEVVVGPIYNQPPARARPAASMEHAAGDPPPAASGPDRPVEHSGVDPVGHYRVPGVDRF
jgi:hypothetical protein